MAALGCLHASPPQVRIMRAEIDCVTSADRVFEKEQSMLVIGRCFDQRGRRNVRRKRFAGVIIRVTHACKRRLGIVDAASAILAGELDAPLVAEPIAEGQFEKAPAFIEELVIVAAAGQPPIGKPAPFRARLLRSSRAARIGNA
jgi:hypothetical protein